MKIITAYLKYLIGNKSKIAWIIALNLIVGAFSFYFFKDIQDIIGDNSVWAVVGICALITAIRVAVDLHPFIEWRDGLEKKERESLNL
jgi:hypothetical protein